MTTNWPPAATMPMGAVKAGPLPVLASETMVRSPLAGSTRNTASSPLSTTASWPSACVVMQIGAAKFGPLPVLASDMIVRLPLTGSTRTTASRLNSVTAS